MRLAFLLYANSNNQAPNPNIQISTKHKIPSIKQLVWNLGIGICLEFGIWKLEFSHRLELNNVGGSRRHAAVLISGVDDDGRMSQDRVIIHRGVIRQEYYPITAAQSGWC